MALAYRYPRGAVVGADPAAPVVPDGVRLTGEPGTRAPHQWLTRSGERVSTLDLYERSMVLLSSADGSGGWHDAALDVARELDVPLDSYRVGVRPEAELAPADDTEWAEAHGVSRNGAVLVRPDGFVAWRSAEGPRIPPRRCGRRSPRSSTAADPRPDRPRRAWKRPEAVSVTRYGLRPTTS